MKRINLLFLFLLIFNYGCESNSKIPEIDRVSDRMVLDFAETMAPKGLHAVGIGGGMNHETKKLRLFGVTFITGEEIKTVAQARLLFVETILAFLDFINAREDIREYLDVSPVTIENGLVA